MAKRGENIYKRKDGRYEGRYIKGRRIDGRPHFGYIYGYTYNEVKTELTFAKANVGQTKSVCFIGKGSLGEFLSYWLESEVKGRVKDSTYARYYERIHNHIIPSLGQALVGRITKENIQNFVDGLCKTGLAPSTIKSITGLLHCAIRKAAEFHLTEINPFDGVTLPKVAEKERSALNRVEQVKLEKFATCSGSSIEMGVFLALYTGLRIGEICALKWRDIDLVSKTLTVRGTLQRIKNFDSDHPKTVLLESSPKSKRSQRLIPLPNDIADALMRYGKDISKNDYVLTGSAKPIEPRTLRFQFDKLSAKAGLSIPFHSLRHTYATRCLENNFDIQTLSELLGHATASTTIKVYSHSMFEHKKLLMERINILSDIFTPSNEPSAAYAVH